jgi:hypothetical protein
MLGPPTPPVTRGAGGGPFTGRRRNGFRRSQLAPRKRGSDEPGDSSRNITDDPELRYTQGGTALAGFTVAVSHRSNRNGQWQDVD